jgi:hypothetical protein
MLIAVLLVALAAPAFADKKATPNDNALFGQWHKVGGGKVFTDVLKEAAVLFETNVGQAIKIIKPILSPLP